MATPIPDNRAELTLETLLEATGGELVCGDRAAPARIVGISTDTRALRPGAAFVALAGKSSDGHSHLGAAAAAGAALAVVDRQRLASADALGMPLPVVAVDSPLEALAAIARAHARSWRALGGQRRLVAITGSAGKTTTRVAAQALLHALAPGAVHATAGNLNNRIGAPMILLGLEPWHRYGVLELGTNEPGEIGALAAMVEPDAGVLTLVAAAHVEGLGSIEGVAREKGALLAALSRDGVAIGCGDDERVSALVASSPASRRILYGFGPGLCVRIVRRDLILPARAEEALANRLAIEVRDLGRIDVVSPLLGEAGALACAAAISIAVALGLAFDGEIVTRALSHAEVGGGAGRLVPRVLRDGTWLLDDSYNANPASMKASIRAAAEIARAAGRRLVLVLGEMRELGVETERGHAEVGVAAAESGAAKVIAVSGAAVTIASAARSSGADAAFAATTEAAAELALSEARPGDVVLVKGSRGVATERVVAALAARAEEERR